MQISQIRLTWAKPVSWSAQAQVWRDQLAATLGEAVTTQNDSSHRAGGKQLQVRVWHLHETALSHWPELEPLINSGFELLLSVEELGFEGERNGPGFLQLSMAKRFSVPASATAATDLLIQCHSQLNTLFETPPWKADTALAQSPPTLFFYLQPDSIPDQPDAYFDPHHLPLLKLGCRNLLHCDDPLSSQVSGGFVEGNLLMLRVDPDQRRERPETRHLLVPCLTPLEHQEELDQDLLFIINSWAGQEYGVANRLNNTATLYHLRKSSHYLQYLTKAVDDMPRQMQRIRVVAATEGAEPATRETVDLLALNHRLRHDLYLRTQDAIDLGEELRRKLKFTDSTFRRLFAIRDLPHLRPLDDALENLPGNKGLRERIYHLRTQAKKIRTAFEAYRGSLSAILELNRKEESVRAERRQRFLGYAIAALALVSAIPLIIGEITPQTVHDALLRLPAPLDISAAVAQALFPWFTFIAFWGALLIIASALVISIKVVTRKRHDSTPAVDISGKALATLRREHALAEEATAQRGSVDRPTLRDLDLRCAEALSEAINMAHNTDRPLDRFIIRTELGCRRPTPMLLPVSACLIRHALDYRGRWLDDKEFQHLIEPFNLSREIDTIFGEAAQHSLSRFISVAEGAFYR